MKRYLVIMEPTPSGYSAYLPDVPGCITTGRTTAEVQTNMREALALDRQRRQAATRHHSDGHAVALRALPDYDALFGVDFNPPATKAR